MKKNGGGDPMVIIGGGMAGLRAAQVFQSLSQKFVILEAGDQPGGRIQTQYQQGFQLDIGFQVLQTTYPELKKSVCLKNLNLCYFAAGALLWCGNRFWKVSDPFRQPWNLVETLRAPIGSWWDKVLIGRLKQLVLGLGEEKVWHFSKGSTMEFLCNFGFSERIIQSFFRPFLSGVFLEMELETPARQFAFVFRHFSLANAAVPTFGMGAVAQEMIRDFPEDSIRLRTKAISIRPQKEKVLVGLESGEVISAKSVVMAGNPREIPGLLEVGGAVPSDFDPPFKAVTTHWFASPRQIRTGPFLILDGTGSGPVNHAAVLSEVSGRYAPLGQSLIALCCVGQSNADSRPTVAQSQARNWWGSIVEDWRHLHTDRIVRALPMTRNMPIGPGRPPSLDARIHFAGDHMSHPSVEGAMVSGRRAALACVSNQP